MATTSIGTANGGDAVVVPQDRGSGLPSSADPSGVDAAQDGLLCKYQGQEYHTTTLTSDPSTDTVDVSAGVAFVHDTSTSTAGLRDGSGNPQIRSDKSANHDTPVPEDPVVVIVIPTAKTDLSGAVDTSGQDVYLSYDPTAQNTVTLHHGDGIATPSEPYIKLGTFDSTSSGTATEENTTASSGGGSSHPRGGYDPPSVVTSTSYTGSPWESARVDTGAAGGDVTFTLPPDGDLSDGDMTRVGVNDATNNTDIVANTGQSIIGNNPTLTTTSSITYEYRAANSTWMVR